MSVNDQQTLDPAEDAHLPDFYRSLGNNELLEKIQNLDDRHVFLDFHNRASKVSSRNFVIDFGEDEAWGGFDLSAGGLKALLDAEVVSPPIHLMMFPHEFSSFPIVPRLIQCGCS